jgi:hypothetical protein
MSAFARLRWLVARHPSIHWIVIGTCGLVAWSVLRGMAGDADEERRRWGTTATVWVTDVDVLRGDAVVASATEVPLALVPADALPGDQPLDGVATHDLSAGEVVVGHDVATADDAPATWVVMAVPADTAPRLVVGDRVAVFGSGALLCDGVVTAAAVEVDGRRTVDVALPPDCAADVSAHLASGVASLGRRT